MTIKKPTIMVVDDDSGVRNAMRILLKSVGLESVSYASAQEFLAAYQPSQPGCLLLDVREGNQTLVLPLVRERRRGSEPDDLSARVGAHDHRW